MKIDIETIELVQAIRLSVNSADLKDIQLYRKGQRVRIDKKVVAEFDFTGLNNWDFFAYSFFKNKDHLKEAL